MALLLAGDIGGTHTLLQLFHRQGRQSTVVAELSYRSADYSGLTPMVRQFLGEVGEGDRLQGAAFGVAGPVVGGHARLTNLGWHLTVEQLAWDLGVPLVRLMNDFVAVGWGVDLLTPEQMVVLQDVPDDPFAPSAIIGAGTGLGECFCVPGDRGPTIVASEGAHADFAPRNEREWELLRFLQQQYDTDHVSVERVVSGQGIGAIYRFLAQQQPKQVSDTLQHALNSDEDLAAAVSTAALVHQDPLAREAMQLFVDAYAAEAGNMALKLLPYGGIWIAGGIAPKILPLLQTDRFLEVFRAKGRLSRMMPWFPIRVVLEPRVGLLGAARAAASCI